MKPKRVEITTPASFKLGAEASRDNPNLGWLEFVLTDDKPNDNKQGIPKEAFASLVESGLHMPLRMAEGKISDDHEGIKPIGSIATLAASTEQVTGTAAIWKVYKQIEYDMLKKMHADGAPINISWEISYSESSKDEDEVEWIQDPSLIGAAIVGSPAYAGRTQVTTVASTEGDPPKDDPPTDDGREAELVAKIAKLEASIQGMEAQIEELNTYKEEREQKDTQAALLESRLATLAEAGFKFSAEEIEKNKVTWLAMSDEIFAAMVNLMKDVKLTEASTLVPDLTGDTSANAIELVRQGFKDMKES